MLSPPAWGHIPHVTVWFTEKKGGWQTARGPLLCLRCHPHPRETFPVPQMSVDNYSGASNAPRQHESPRVWRQKGQQYTSLSWVYIWRGSETWCKREKREGARAWWSITIHRAPWLLIRPACCCLLKTTHLFGTPNSQPFITLWLPFISLSSIVECNGETIMQPWQKTLNGKAQGYMIVLNERTFLDISWKDEDIAPFEWSKAATMPVAECATHVCECVWTGVLKSYIAFTLVQFMALGCEV